MKAVRPIQARGDEAQLAVEAERRIQFRVDLLRVKRSWGWTEPGEGMCSKRRGVKGDAQASD